MDVVINITLTLEQYLRLVSVCEQLQFPEIIKYYCTG